MEAVIFWLPNCDTCKKAAAFLQRNNVVVTRFHNLKAEKLSRTEIEKLAEMVGGVENLFSRRAIKYRELRLNKREVLPTEMFDLIESDYTFVKRPVLVIGNRAISGFSEKNWIEFIK
jgi:arsenate reductase (glutaredoxin)